MSLRVGTQLGSLEITGLLGRGGMGEVYRARDLKLKREVAIKILPEEFSRDPDRVNRFQRVADLSGDAERLLHRQRATRDAIREGFAFHQFENEKTSALRLPNIMNRRDVGVIERCQYLGFALKAAYPIRITRELFRQDLDRDITLQFQIPSTVNLTHSPATEEPRDFE